MRNLSFAGSALALGMLTACGGGSADPIVGTWNCNIDASEQGMSIKIATKDNYKANGESSSNGKIEMDVMGSQISMDYKTTGKWTRAENELTQTIENVDVSNIDVKGEMAEMMPKEQLDAMFSDQIKQQMAGEETQTVTIKEITGSSLVLSQDGTDVTCKK